MRRPKFSGPSTYAKKKFLARPVKVKENYLVLVKWLITVSEIGPEYFERFN